MDKGISVVIPVKNRTRDLMLCVRSVLCSFETLKSKNESYKKIQVIVIDDHSEEDLRKSMEMFKEIEIYRNGIVGPGAARNFGLKKAKYEYVGFIDSDCEADKKWLLNIVSGFDKNNVYAIQGNPYLFIKKQNATLGNCEEKLYSGMFKTYIKGKYCYQIDTRNCAFRKTIINKLKSELFITDMEKAQAEARVCGNNLVSKNMRILYCDNMKVYHKDPSSLKESMKQKIRHGSGRTYVWDKTPSFKHLFTRYYWNPIKKFNVPFWYVIPTHSAFLWGYFQAKWKQKK